MIECPSCSVEQEKSSKFCSECGATLHPGYAATVVQERTPLDAGSRDRGDSPSDISRHGRFFPGAILAGRYRVVSLVGKGGMGEVYQADDLKLGQPVALKILPRTVASDARRLEYFHNEVRLARQISHPNVCRVHDIGEVDGLHFLSMEFIDGEDLKGLLRRIGRLPSDKGIEIARQLCAGLAAAHDQGVLHRDLKPANVILDRRGHVRLTDFGLAQAVGDESEEISGTPSYMAPEQLLRGETSIQSDLYSLGLLLYELFTGQQPLGTASVEELRKLHREESSVTPPSELIADMDSLVESVILDCLETEPKRRPASVRTVAAALPGGDPLAAAIAAGETPSPEVVAASGGTMPIPRQMAISCMALLVIGVISWPFVYSLENPQPSEHAMRPIVLADHARKVLSKLGYEEADSHRAFGLSLTKDAAASGKEIPAHFWYRQSPQPMIPDIRRIEVLTSARITETNPPPAPGAALLILDLDGRLLEFELVPDKEEVAEPAEKADWKSIISDVTGWDLGTFIAVEPVTVPPFYVTERFAWERNRADSETDFERVEFGALDGKLVFLRTFRSKPLVAGKSQVVEHSHTHGGWGEMTIWIVFAYAVYLLRVNVRRGRADLRGAIGLGVFAFVLRIVTWYLASSMMANHSSWNAFGEGLATAVSISVFYLAFEPIARRNWPELLVSWNRLLAGQLRDPTLGRDLLVGLLAGVLLHIGTTLLRSQVAFGTSLGFGELQLLSLEEGKASFVGFFTSLWAGLNLALSACIMLAVLRLGLRHRAIAIGAFMVLRWVFLASSIDLSWLLLVLFVVGETILLTRIGIVALVAYWFSSTLLYVYVFTTDLSIWYANGSVFVLTTIVALGGYGFYTSLAGNQLLFPGVLGTKRR